ncbi:HAMP domain-containing methyl-accepting chemotaxis protein [Halobacteriovorax marinus]|uniref:HAMP domain-containing methyl-accepting chemotaxis protein n=1 Tax=Halobacteriovorax marinus TaxID=97084 RepID=UPI003A8D2FB3
MKLKIQTQIITLVSFLFAFQVIICAISYIGLTSISEELDSVFSRSLPSIDNLVQADRDFQQSLVAERTLLLSGLDSEQKKKQVGEYYKNRAQVLERFSIYEKLAKTKEEKEIIEVFKTKYQDWVTISDTSMPLTESGYEGDLNTLMNTSLNVTGPAFESSRDQLDALQEVIQTKAKVDFDVARENYKEVELLMFSILGGCLLFTIGLSFYFIRSIKQKIENTINNVTNESLTLNNISGLLGQRATELASASQQQSASVTQTSSSLHEISEMVNKNTSTAVSSADLVNTGKRELDKGLQMILNLAEKVKDMNTASSELITKVDNNHKRFEEILGVFNNVQDKTSVINDIVFQTKLLSFNASVEAARAGEHGKGFSVVAEEVGNLAHMSGNSANEISELLEGSLSNISSMIENSKSEVSSAVKKSEEIITQTLDISARCEQTLKEIDQMFIRVTESTNEIATASQEQSSGVGEINTAVQEIDSANQLTTKSAHQVEESSKELISVAVSLEGSIDELKKLVA